MQGDAMTTDTPAPEPLGQRAAIRAEEVARRAARIERYAEQRRAEAGNWAPGSTLHAEVLAHAETIAGDATTLRELAEANAALVKRAERAEAAGNAMRLNSTSALRLAERYETERDAALASAERLEEALETWRGIGVDAVEILAVNIDEWDAHHRDEPDEIMRDLQARIRAALATEPPQ